MKVKTFGYVVLGIAVLMLGLFPVAYRFANSTDPLTLALYIALVGTVASFILMMYKGTQGYLVGYFTKRTPLLVILACGLLEFAGINLIFSYTTHYITASLVAVIYRTWPLMALLLAPLLLRERISKMELLGVFIAFAGMAIAFLWTSGNSLTGVALPALALVFLAALMDAVVSSLQKRYSYELTSLIFAFNLVSAAALLPIALYFNAASPDFTSSIAGAVIFIGILQNVLITFFFILAFRSVKTSVASNAFMLVPFATMVFEFLILGQPIVLAYVAMAISVCIGFVVVNIRSKNASSYVASRKDTALPTIYDVTSAFVSTGSAGVSRAMHAGGKVLAFYKKVEASGMDRGIDMVEKMNDDGSAYGECFLFTSVDPADGIRPAEMEYVKEIVGHGDDDLVVLGAGEPSAVEHAFEELHSKLQ